MNKVYPILFVVILTSCQTQDLSVSSEKYGYDRIEALIIPWEGLFDVGPDHYLALVFSKSCQHCLAIEDTVVRYALAEGNTPLFFIPATSEIPKGNDLSKTLGATSIEEVFIMGWPTLLELSSGILIDHRAGEKAVLEKLV